MFIGDIKNIIVATVTMENKKSICDAKKISLKDIINIVDSLLTFTDPSQVEIEARLKGHIINKECVNRLISDNEIEWKKYTFTEKKRISQKNRKCMYRQRNKNTICKSSIAKIDMNDIWSTIHVSTEMPIQSMSHALEKVDAIKVTRSRGKLGNHYIDVTFDENNDPRVEIEVCDTKEFNWNYMEKTIILVCRKLQGSKQFVNFYDWKTVVHVMKNSFGPFCIDKSYYQKPKTMTYKEMQHIKSDLDNWVFTPKIDGVRKFIIILGLRVFGISITKDVQYEGNLVADDMSDTGYQNNITILDCEYADSKYYIFDIAVINGIYCGGKKLLKRIEMINDLREQYKEFFDLYTVDKPYFPTSTFREINNIYKRIINQYNIDGLIFSNMTGNYMSPVYKWKTFSTVDLEVHDETVLMTCDNKTIDIPWKQIHQQKLYGVWEFYFDAENNELVPKRHRPDKPRANSMTIVTSNIIKSVPGTIFSGVGCYLMRKYHNSVKREMLRKEIQGSTDKVILDIGTGQGGDFNKWDKASKVYCVDPNSESTDEMIRRHGKQSNIIVLNTSLRDLNITLINDKINVFVAFFCMNLFEDKDWDMLSMLIKEKSAPKCKLLAIAVTNPKDCNNNVFNVKLNVHEIDKYTINIKDTRIGDRTENIVKSKCLNKLMLSNNMIEVEEKRLDYDDFMTTEEKTLSSMYTKFVYRQNYKKSKLSAL